MKNVFWKKAGILALTAVLSVSILSACGSKETTEQSTATTSQTATNSSAGNDPIQAELAKGEVNLTMYLAGDAQTDQNEVYAEINKLLVKDINTTVTINNVPWADVQKKYQLMFASGEEFDCALGAGFLNYYDLATKNAFKEINEDWIKTYAPETYADLDPYYVKGSKVNGKMYLIPANQHETRGSLVAIRGDLRVKYNLPEIKSQDDYFNYLTAVAKNEKISAFNASVDNTSWYDSIFGRYNGFTNINNLYCNNVKTFDEKLTVFNALESQEYLNFAKKMRELNEAGVFPKSMLSQKTQGKEFFKAGTTASFMEEPNGLYSTVSEINAAHPEWKIEVYDISNPNMPLTGLSPADAGLVLNPKTKHVERVLMMYNLFREKKEYHDLTYLGIEGKHWKAEGNQKFSPLPASKGFPFNAASPWAWTNDKYKRVDAETPQSLIDIKEKWKGMTKNSAIQAFAFNDVNVKNEEAALNNIISKYKNVLMYGFAADVEKTITQMNDELKKAGLEKVHKETQTKIDEFLVQYNK